MLNHQPNIQKYKIENAKIATNPVPIHPTIGTYAAVASDNSRNAPTGKKFSRNVTTQPNTPAKRESLLNSKLMMTVTPNVQVKNSQLIAMRSRTVSFLKTEAVPLLRLSGFAISDTMSVKAIWPPRIAIPMIALR